MTQELLSAADAGRVRIAIGRASDFSVRASPSRRSANACVRQRTRWQACRLPRQPGPAAHAPATVPDIAARAGDAGYGRSRRRRRGVAPAWPGGRHYPPDPRAHCRGGRTPGPPFDSMPQAPAWRTLGLVNPMMREAGRDGLRVRGTIRARHLQVRVNVWRCWNPTCRRHHHHHRLVSQCRHRPVPGRAGFIAGTKATLAGS